jgi:hypothetical protein
MEMIYEAIGKRHSAVQRCHSHAKYTTLGRMSARIPRETLTESPYQAFWQLSTGEHRFWATGVTVNGETVTSEAVMIEVQ